PRRARPARWRLGYLRHGAGATGLGAAAAGPAGGARRRHTGGSSPAAAVTAPAAWPSARRQPIATHCRQTVYIPVDRLTLSNGAVFRRTAPPANRAVVWDGPRHGDGFRHQIGQSVSSIIRSPASRAAATTVAAIVGGVVAATALAQPVQAQTQATLLRGSRASVERMYRQAQDHDLTFYETPASVREGIRKGRVERLETNSDFTLHAVSFPYVIASTRVFVERLAKQYRSACGEQLVVTSAVRPETRQPANSSANSVHPTG